MPDGSFIDYNSIMIDSRSRFFVGRLRFHDAREPILLSRPNRPNRDLRKQLPFVRSKWQSDSRTVEINYFCINNCVIKWKSDCLIKWLWSEACLILWLHDRVTVIEWLWLRDCDWVTVWTNDCVNGLLCEWMTVWLEDYLIEWLADWMTGRFNDLQI